MTGPLYTEDEAAEERAAEDEEDLAEAFRAMAARRAVSGVDVGDASLRP